MGIPLNTENVRKVAGTSLTNSFANVGSAVANPPRIVQIFNGCDQDVAVSWDGGVTTGWDLPPNSATSIDCCINKTADGHSPQLKKGSQFQAKYSGSAPTAGNLTITVIY